MAIHDSKIIKFLTVKLAEEQLDRKALQLETEKTRTNSK